MPAKAGARSQILHRIRQSLAVVTEPDFENEISSHMNAVLDEGCVEPLLQLIAADSEVDRLCVLLPHAPRQLTEWRRRVAAERESTQNRITGLTTGPA